MKTVVFDIETIADLEACARAGVDPEEGFPPWPLHQLMCVSLLTAERNITDQCHFDITTFSRIDHSERAIIASVQREIGDANLLISYNGRAFDLPVLQARAIVVGEHVPTLVRAGRRSNAGFHLDMIDVVSANNAAPRPKLAHVCAAIGIPVKMEAAGGGVAELAARGDYCRIGRYCETDVVATWLLAQMYDSLELPGRGLDQWALLADWIRSQQPKLAHMLPYLELPTMPGGGASFDDGAGAILRF